MGVRGGAISNQFRDGGAPCVGWMGPIWQGLEFEMGFKGVPAPDLRDDALMEGQFAQQAKKRIGMASAFAELLRKTTRSLGVSRSDRSGIPMTLAGVSPLAADLLQELLDAVAVEMALLDDHGVILAVNASWRAALADTSPGGRAGGVGLSYLDVCRELYAESDDEPLRRGLEGLIAGVTRKFIHVYTVQTRRGPRRRRLTLTSLSTDSRACFVATHEDLAETATHRNSAQSRLVVQDEERQRIAIELHDSTCQHLVALGLGVTRLRRLVGDDVGPQNVLEEMSRSVGEVVKEIRVLSYLMKPPGLEREGLEASVRSFVRGFSARTGLSSSLRIEGPIDEVPPAVRHATFRIIQEAAANVYRHAKAAHIDVRLSVRDDALVVRVADDGRGIETLKNGGSLEPADGVGLASMHTRVAQLSGHLEISCLGRGTVVAATLPLRSVG